MDLFIYLQSATATTIYSADYLQISWYLCIPLSIGPTCRDVLYSDRSSCLEPDNTVAYTVNWLGRPDDYDTIR